jgi:tetratricopeptide (TPR) repeat protein
MATFTHPEAHTLFDKAVAMEEAKPENAANLYKRILALEDNPETHVNLGTICYNRRDYASAEKHYRAALATVPDYALAMFDLANVLDETNRVEEAIAVYETAVKLSPTYADAHYNLALAYEKLGKNSNALPHWQKYVKPDGSSPWGAHAQKSIKRIVAKSGLFLIRENKKPKRTKKRAKLAWA